MSEETRIYSVLFVLWFFVSVLMAGSAYLPRESKGLTLLGKIVCVPVLLVLIPMWLGIFILDNIERYFINE